MADLKCDLCHIKLDKPEKVGLVRILAGDKVVLCKRCRKRIIDNAGLRARDWRQEHGPSIHGWQKVNKYGPVTRSEAKCRKARIVQEAKKRA